jgi:hypothetical protein
VIDLGADPQPFRERRCPDWDDHELLQIDRVGRVRPAVDHVQHRHGQRRGGVAAEVAVQRLSRLRRRSLRDGQRDPEDRVRAQAPLVRRPVELDQPPVEILLTRRVQAGDLQFDLRDVRDRLADAFAAPQGTAVAELDCLVHACRGSRGNGGAPERPGLELDVDLDRGIAARVEDLTPVHPGDRSHPVSPLASS